MFWCLRNLTRTDVPRPGVEITSSSAPTSPARRRMYSRPRPGGGFPVSKPWPSSRTRMMSTEPTRRDFRYRLLAPECLATFQNASTNTLIRAAVSAGFNTSRGPECRRGSSPRSIPRTPAGAGVGSLRPLADARRVGQKARRRDARDARIAQPTRIRTLQPSRTRTHQSYHPRAVRGQPRGPNLVC